MGIIRFISGVYIIFFVILLLFGLFVNIKIGRIYRVLVLLFTCALGFFAFQFEPSRGLDLYRLQQYVLTLSFSGNNFFQVITGTEGVLGGISLSGMITFNSLCFFVRLLGDIHWLSTISVLITFGVILSVVVDYIISNGYSSKAFGWSVLITFMGMQPQYVFSGVRNAIAVALVVLGLYLWIYKKKSIIIAIIFYFLAVTTHPAVLIIIIPIVLCNKSGQLAWRITSLLAVPIIFKMPVILQVIPFSFFQYLANRISFYQNVAFKYDRPEMIASLTVFIVISASLWYLRKDEAIMINEGLETFYHNAYLILGFAMIGCSIHRDFALRIGYIMGIGAMPLICKLLNDIKRSGKIYLLIRIGLFIVLATCCAKVYYDTYLAFSIWSFQ